MKLETQRAEKAGRAEVGGAEDQRGKRRPPNFYFEHDRQHLEGVHAECLHADRLLDTTANKIRIHALLQRITATYRATARNLLQ